MKKLLALILSSAGACVAVFACSTLGGTSVATPAQLDAQVCTPVNAVLAVLNAATNLSATAKANVAKVQPMVTLLCNGAATINTSSVSTFLSTGLPLLESAMVEAGIGTNSPAMGDVLLGVALLQAILTPPATPTPAPAASARLGKLAPGSFGYVCYSNGQIPPCPPVPGR